MTVSSKLQVKAGQSVAVLGPPDGVDLGLDSNDVAAKPRDADAVILFATVAADLNGRDAKALVDAGLRDALAWVAYPKGGQLGTDLNRDSLAALLSERGLRPVRQVSIDDVWSALRFRPAG